MIHVEASVSDFDYIIEKYNLSNKTNIVESIQDAEKFVCPHTYAPGLKVSRGHTTIWFLVSDLHDYMYGGMTEEENRMDGGRDGGF